MSGCTASLLVRGGGRRIVAVVHANNSFQEVRMRACIHYLEISVVGTLRLFVIVIIIIWLQQLRARSDGPCLFILVWEVLVPKRGSAPEAAPEHHALCGSSVTRGSSVSRNPYLFMRYRTYYSTQFEAALIPREVKMRRGILSSLPLSFAARTPSSSLSLRGRNTTRFTR